MWGHGSQLGSDEMANHKPYKFACSSLRLEGPALQKCKTQNTQSRRTRRRNDQVKTFKANNRELIESRIGGKQQQVLQRMKAKHGNTPAPPRPPPCVGLILVLFASCLLHSEQPKTPIPGSCQSAFHSIHCLNTDIRARNTENHLPIKHDKPKQHTMIVDPTSKISMEIGFQCRRDLGFR